ncbi:hypothetical protein PENFLA_c112G02009 [Penicillium flavigenum]|uniref:Uncharacterized protein n=1 Tax=Penicillium flavigenum TaxID=254877 RepID=A0A1V6S609_9EURO|nr:hypothetical protein PENFLA_c112G02009 [Penicillium flavigenum]
MSSFTGDGVNIDAIRSSTRSEIFFTPNFHPGWDSNGNNRAPTSEQTVTIADSDQAYKYALQGKPYIAPISPWFSTHYGPEVSYSKNWVFPSDLLYPRFVEIITWNNYGESHYISPLLSPHIDDGASKWVMDMPHNGWLDIAKPFIAAYKADTTMQGSSDSASGDFTRGRPDGADIMKDEVFVVTMLKLPAMVRVQSGDITKTYIAPPGI